MWIYASAIAPLFLGPIWVRAAEVEPIRIIDAKCEAWSGIGLSSNGRQLFCYDIWTVHQVDLCDNEESPERPLPKQLRGERIYSGAHVEKDIWLLSLDPSAFRVDADGKDNRFVLFDFAAEAVLADWSAHHHSGCDLAVAPKQNWLITAGSSPKDVTVCFWDRKTQKQIREIDLAKELKLKAAPGSWIETKAIAIDPTSSFLAFGFHGGMIYTLDLKENVWHEVVPKQAGLIGSLNFVNDRILAVRYIGILKSGKIDLHDWKAKTKLFSIEYDGASLTPIAVAPDKRTIAVGATSKNGGDVHFWDVTSQKEITSFHACDNTGLRMLTFDADGKRLITSSRDGTIRIWNAEQILKEKRAKK